MTNINGVSPYNYNKEDIKTNYEQNDIQLEDISILYTTDKKEEDRTTFEETFNNVYVNDSGQGQKFLSGLIDNKENLMKELGLTEDQYDSLACTALALASQETGMGQEEGYNEENKGIGKLFRGILKQIDVLRGGASASSGLTQMKIYDFINDPTKLSEEQKNILKEYGITDSMCNYIIEYVKGKLFEQENPDVANMHITRAEQYFNNIKPSTSAFSQQVVRTVYGVGD